MKIWLLTLGLFIFTFATLIATAETRIESFQLLNILPLFGMQYVWRADIYSDIREGKLQFNIILFAILVLISAGFITEIFLPLHNTEFIGIVAFICITLFILTVILNSKYFRMSGGRFNVTKVLNLLLPFLLTFYLPFGMYILKKRLTVKK